MRAGNGIGVVLFNFITAASTTWHPAKGDASLTVQIEDVKRILSAATWRLSSQRHQEISHNETSIKYCSVTRS
jgi:hypothetical protein